LREETQRTASEMLELSGKIQKQTAMKAKAEAKRSPRETTVGDKSGPEEAKRTLK